jgi:hypothetical protein
MEICTTPQVVVFSDVDGVLVRPSAASVARATAAFERRADESVSVVLCSLKTRGELELLQQQLGGGFDAVGAVIQPGAPIAALRALYGRDHERVITIGLADRFASPGHLDAMDAKVIAYDEPGVSGPIDAGDWAEAIAEAVEDIRLRGGIAGRHSRTWCLSGPAFRGPLDCNRTSDGGRAGALAKACSRPRKSA